MQRVLIIGSPGAGKSTFARRLAASTALPVVHLDQHYWLAGWTEPDADTWHETIKQLLAQPRWIMDGDYGGTLDMRLRDADTVFFLDLPRWLCIMRVLKRITTTYGRTRPDLQMDAPSGSIGNS
jgi:adenylate kinase family enzyme